jgi:hypothetical protein
MIGFTGLPLSPFRFRLLMNCGSVGLASEKAVNFGTGSAGRRSRIQSCEVMRSFARRFPHKSHAERFCLLANTSTFTHTGFDRLLVSLSIPKFASLCGVLVCELRNRQTGWRSGGFMVATAVRSAGVRFVLQMAIALSFCTFAAESRAYTAEQQQACMGDAFRLCSSEIPYVDRVAACMVRQQSQLSPGCRVYFRPEPADPSATASVSIRPAHLRKWRKPRKHIQHDDT